MEKIRHGKLGVWKGLRQGVEDRLGSGAMELMKGETVKQGSRKQLEWALVKRRGRIRQEGKDVAPQAEGRDTVRDKF